MGDVEMVFGIGKRGPRRGHGEKGTICAEVGFGNRKRKRAEDKNAWINIVGDEVRTSSEVS